MSHWETLIRGYGHTDAALQLPLTLDRYVQPVGEAPDHRDQVVYRWTRQSESPQIIMVDQLWMWVVGGNKIVTCSTEVPSGDEDPERLAERVAARVSVDSVQPDDAVLYLADRITAACVRGYHETEVHHSKHALGMFSLTISKIVSTISERHLSGVCVEMQGALAATNPVYHTSTRQR
jgi:hypothetical protein